MENGWAGVTEGLSGTTPSPPQSLCRHTCVWSVGGELGVHMWDSILSQVTDQEPESSDVQRCPHIKFQTIDQARGTRTRKYWERMGVRT